MSYELSIVILAGDDVVDRFGASRVHCDENFRLRSVVAGVIPNDGSLPRLTIAPRWSAEGEPVASGFSLRSDDFETHYDAGIFENAARRRIATLEAKALTGRNADADKAEWTWRLEALPLPARPCVSGRAERRPYPFLYARLAPQNDAPLLSVRIDEIVQAAARRHLLDCRAVEVGALLAGSLYFDPDQQRIEVHASDYVPVAPSAESGSSAAHFGFGIETFRTAASKVCDDSYGRIVVGHSHTHPPCAACFERSDCRTDTVFFSLDDYAVHAGAFPMPYHIATVFGKLGERSAMEPSFRVYGWNDARLVEIQPT